MQVGQAKELDVIVFSNMYGPNSMNGLYIAHEEVKEQNQSPITITTPELINA